MAAGMASVGGGDNRSGAGVEPDDRRSWRPRVLGEVLPAVVRPAYRKRSPGTAQLLADWEAIVGPAIAATTTPRKLFGGTLVIVCTGPMATELQHLGDVLIGRINTHLGRVAVTRLRFAQDVLPTLPPRPKPRLAVEAAGRAVAGLPEGGLRDALERLGQVVLAGR